MRDIDDSSISFYLFFDREAIDVEMGGKGKKRQKTKIGKIILMIVSIGIYIYIYIYLIERGQGKTSPGLHVLVVPSVTERMRKERMGRER